MAEDFVPKGLLAGVGFACGASAFFFGFYGTTVWEPIALGALAILLGIIVARPSLPRGAGAVAVAGLLGLWVWSLLSSTWAEAANEAVTDANRWLLYAAFLAGLLMLLQVPGSRHLLIAAVTAGVLVMAAYIDLRLLLGDGSGLFVGNRLNGPLDYINAEATYLLMGLWPLVAFAERTRSPLLGGFSVFAGVQLLSMALLTQSRGALVALVVSTAAMLILVPGRIPRAWAILAMLIGTAIALPGLQHVINATGRMSLSDDTLRTAAETSLAGGAVMGATWFAVQSGVAKLLRRRPAFGSGVRTISVAGIILVCIGGAAIVALPPGKRIDQVREQYNAFTQLRAVGSGSRLASGGGHRYDYWRIAWDQFTDDPLRGVGAGNYNRTYYLDRRTTDDIKQAHSIELQTLGETGLVGSIGLAMFVGAVSLGFWRRAHGAHAELMDPSIAVPAGGIFMVWLVHSSVDWPHLIPGLTGIALIATATLLPAARPAQLRRPGVWIAIAIVVTGAAAFPVVRQTLALRLQGEGRELLRSDPKAAIRKSNRSLDLQESTETSYVKAAAYARLGAYSRARAALLDSARSEPHNFVTWGLLGDLATRHGDSATARRYYRRASALNPRDPGLAALAGGSASGA